MRQNLLNQEIGSSVYIPSPPLPPPPNSASEDGVVPSSLNSKLFENNFFVKK